jgi:PAS domain S-box-containing protein
MTQPAPTDLDAALLRARLKLHDDNVRAPLAASLFAGSTLVVMLGLSDGWHIWLAGWLCLLAAALGVRWWLARAWRREQARDPDRIDEAADRRWLLRHRLAYGLHGLAWASLSLLFPVDMGSEAMQTVAFIATAMAGGAMITGAFDAVASIAFAVPTLVPLLANLLGSDATPAIGHAVVASVFLIIMLGASRRAAAFFRTQVESSLVERQRLVEARRNAADAESARRELADQHELLRQLIRGTPQGFWFVDPKGGTIEVNPAMCSLLGRSREEVLKLGVFGCFAGPERDVLERELAARRGGSSGGYEIDIVRPDGSRLHAINHATPIFDTAGVPLGSIGLWTDLTAQKQQQDALRTYERLANSIEDRVSVIGADRCWRLVNDAWCRQTGLSREEVIGRPALAGPPHAGIGVPVALVEACFADGTVATQTAAVQVGGRTLHLQTTCLPYRDVDNRVDPSARDTVRGVIVVTRDLTEQEEASENLRQSEAELRALFEAFPGYIGVMDDALRYIFVNRRVAGLLGHAPEALVGRAARDTLDEGRWREVQAETARARGGEVVRADRLYPSGDGREPLRLEVTHLAGPPRRDGRQVLYTFGLDVSAHHAALAALAQARDEAQQANEAKSRFLSHMSHELRTPLNAIAGFAQLLERDRKAPLPPHQAVWVGHIQRGAQHLTTLIGELLDLGRIEAGELALQSEPVALPDLFDECLGFVAQLARQRQVRLLAPALQGGPAATAVQADRTRLKQVLLNLLSNAIKYNRTGGDVQLLVAVDGTHLLLKVRDTGPGLSADQQARLFQRFERLGAERGVIEGTGIGLLLCRHLVEAMAGQIGVDSQPGQGSVFWVRLPMATVPLAAPAAPGAQADPSPAAGKTLAVLAIDDNPVNLMLVQAMLEDEPGLRVQATTDPVQGLDLARRERPGLVLVDIHMPVLTGYQVLQRLQSDPSTAGVPVVALSADAAATEVSAALAAGFRDYLTKPLEMQVLLDLVRATRDA